METEGRGYPRSSVKGWIVFFSILFGLLLIPTLILTTLNYTIFQPEFYSKALEKQHFYDQLPGQIAETVINSIESNGFQGIEQNVFAALSKEQLEALLVAVIPEGWMQAQTEEGIKSVLGFLNFETIELKLRVNLQPIKDNLTGPDGKQVLKSFLAALPPCSGDQLSLIISGLINGQVREILLCNPPLTDLGLLDPVLNQVMGQFAAKIPCEITIPAGQPAGQIRPLVETGGYKLYRLIRQTMIFLPWACLGFGLLIILFSMRSIRWMFASLGVPMIFSGFVAGSFGAILFFGGNQDIHLLLGQNSPAGLQGIEQLIIGIGQDIFISVGRIILIASLVTLLSGLILFLASRIFKE